MATLAESEALDKAKAEEIISKIELIPEVQSIDVEVYTDHTGDPSFQVVFNLRKGLKHDQAFHERLADFSQQVQIKILHSDLNRFPYPKIRSAA